MYDNHCGRGYAWLARGISRFYSGYMSKRQNHLTNGENSVL